MTEPTNPFPPGTQDWATWIEAHPTSCPDWCEGRGDHHDAWWRECIDGLPDHMGATCELSLPELHDARGIARQRRLSAVLVDILLRQRAHVPFVRVSVSDGRAGRFATQHLTAGEARSLAAMLIHAANVLEGL